MYPKYFLTAQNLMSAEISLTKSNNGNKLDSINNQIKDYNNWASTVRK